MSRIYKITPRNSRLNHLGSRPLTRQRRRYCINRPPIRMKSGLLSICASCQPARRPSQKPTEPTEPTDPTLLV